MLKKIPLFVLVILSIWSCTGSNTGLLLSSEDLRDGIGDSSNVIQYLSAGDKVEYLGELPYPNEGFMRVKFGTAEGYVLASTVVFGARPVVARADIAATPTLNSTEQFQIAYEGSFLLADSVSGDKTHIYSIVKSTHGWVDTKDLSTNPDDIAVSSAIERMTSVHGDDTFAIPLFQAAIAQYPTNALLKTFKVDLGEASDDDMLAMQTGWTFAYDKALNTVTIPKQQATSIIDYYISDILMRPQGDSPEGYRDGAGQYVNTIPIERYFRRYVSALPSFVKATGLSEAVDWDIYKEEEQSPASAFFIYRFDRSAENIKNLYSQYRPLIESKIMSGYIRNIRGEGYMLIKVYEHITALDNYKKVMSDLKQNIDTWDQKHTNADGRVPGGYALLDKRQLYEPIILEAVFNNEASENRAMWYHSFWVRRFAEGNAEVVYDILKDLMTIEPGEAPAEDTDGESFGDAPDGYATGNEEPVTSTCSFQGFSVGDCAHYDFGECGDYGDADVSELSEEDLALWKDLVATVDGEEVGNPKWIGKKFSITETITMTDICNEGQGGQGQAPKILSIKVVEN